MHIAQPYASPEEAVLAHHGVKGMRWGVRKDQEITVGGETKQVTARQAKKADQQWKKDFESGKGPGFDDQKFTKAYNEKWKDHDFSKEDWSNPSPTYQKYQDGYFRELNREYTKQYAEHFGSSPTGKMKVSLTEVDGEPHIKLVHNEVKHADTVEVMFKVTFDSKGLIVNLEQVKHEVEHGDYLESIFADDSLEHHGVKGMKWGVRKRQDKPTPEEIRGLIHQPIVRTTKNGDEFTLSAKPPGKLLKALAKRSPNYVKTYNTSAFMSIRDKDGKKIGDLQLYDQGKGNLYINWIGTKNSVRGKGYATATMQAVEDHARQKGYKKLTLEVPGDSPDARHIYEKQGFVAGKQISDATKDSVWGGLTEMEKKLD